MSDWIETCSGCDVSRDYAECLGCRRCAICDNAERLPHCTGGQGRHEAPWGADHKTQLSYHHCLKCCTCPGSPVEAFENDWPVMLDDGREGLIVALKVRCPFGLPPKTGPDAKVLVRFTDEFGFLEEAVELHRLTVPRPASLVELEAMGQRPLFVIPEPPKARSRRRA